MTRKEGEKEKQRDEREGKKRNKGEWQRERGSKNGRRKEGRKRGVGELGKSRRRMGRKTNMTMIEMSDEILKMRWQ